MSRARQLQTELATRFAERVVRAWRNRSETSDDVSRRSGVLSRAGHTAVTPTHISLQGWREIFWRVIEGIQRDRVLLIAAGVAFFGLLALFPAIASVVSVYGLFADTSSINTQLAALSGFMPEGALTVIGDQIKIITQKSGAANWLTFATGLLISIWGANAGTKSVFDALNIIYKEEEKRSFLRLNLQSLLFTLGTVVMMCLAVGAVVVLPAIMAAIGFTGGLGARLLVMARWPLLVAVIMFALACLYRFGPSRAKPKWLWVTPGSIAASTIWLIGSLGFSWYLSNFANYNATYGSLGAVIGFFTWLWLSTTVVLLGAEINSESERQTA